MAIFKTQSFASRLGSLKATFPKTIQSSEQLINEMNTDINQKSVQITKLEEEKKVVEETRSQTETFVGNLKKLIGE